MFRTKAQIQIAQANRVMLIAKLIRKMAGRDIDPEQYRQSKIDSALFLENEESILYITGNSHQRGFLVEHYNRQFELHVINTNNAPSTTSTFSFNTKKLDDIAAAREEFRKLGFHYLGHCSPTNDVAAFIKKITSRTLLLNDIDIAINKALITLFKFENKDDRLSIFDQENAKQISTAKSKYDLWSDEWQEPLTDDFNNVKDKAARKVLQLLQHYVGKDNVEKIFSFHWKRHHRNEIAAVIAPFKENSSLTFPPLSTDLETRIAARQLTASDDNDKDSDAMDVILLEETLKNLNDVLIEDIILVLKTEIMKSKEPTIKAHGDLFALLEVIKDFADVDYFNLKQEISNPSRNAFK